MSEKVGLIGRGNVAKALNNGLERAGYETRMGGRGTARDIAEWGEVLILAVPFGEAENALSEAGEAVNGKVVIDTTNPLTQDLQPSLGFTTSAAEEIQRLVPQAKVVKCFNTVFATGMSDGKVKGEQISVFVAGDDPEARSVAARLAQDIGFDAVDSGILQHSRWIEGLAVLNIQLAFTQNLGNYIGFKLVR